MQNFWHFFAHELLDTISPLITFLASELSLDFAVFLIEFKKLDAAHNILALITQMCRFEVELTLVLKHEDLLLLANCNRGRPSQRFDFVNTYFSISRLLHYRGPLLCKPLLSELRVVSLFPVPVAFVPD